MLYVLARGATSVRRSLLCGAHHRFSQHTPTRPRATRTSTTPPRRAAPCWCWCWCCLHLNLNLFCVRGRHSLGASRGLQLEITALVRRERKSFDSPFAMMHTRRSSAHVSLTAFCCESCVLMICGQLLRVAKVAALRLREGHLPWEHCHALFVAFVGLDISASIFSAAWTCVAAP